ncbi:hypothetical protein IKW73_00565 [Candidatus Saccharibacteria bacterium]|nr:hypothetical protein [Candidatus Saccharibacteria bacterium]
MNKDVVYIEPEDDITDIITKIENTKEKIVALVPPKKAGVFRSVVNIKLIAKAGFASDKTVVLVTTDPSIIKLAAATKIPVTKNLQTAPTVPTFLEDKEEGETVKEDVVEEPEEGEKTEETEEKEEEKEEKEEKEDSEKSEKDLKEKGKEKLSEAKEKGKEAAKNVKKFSLAWFKAHKPLAIGGIIGAILLILFLVWAFVIAPAVTITVKVRTTASNFSKNATFTRTLADENVDAGKFYLEEKKIENEVKVEFDATGKKNIGEKAKGSVVIEAYFVKEGIISVNAGDKFTINELVYTADEATSLSWDGTISKCEAGSNTANISNMSCRISGRVNVTASEPGEKYNIAASSAGWKSTANVLVYSDVAMAGGTDNLVTVVSEDDVKAAKEKLTTGSEEEYKKKLLDTLEDDAFVIDTSFKQTMGDVVSTPAVGEQVSGTDKPSITVKITDTIFLIDKTKVEEFIGKEAQLADNFKIYKMNDPFVENFTETDGGFTGKIKTSYTSGPKVTENDVVEIAKGKGFGEVQHDLKDINGIGSVTIDKSYPWVSSVPGDPNKITVILDINAEE